MVSVEVAEKARAIELTCGHWLWSIGEYIAQGRKRRRCCWKSAAAQMEVGRNASVGRVAARNVICLVVKGEPVRAGMIPRACHHAVPL